MTIKPEKEFRDPIHGFIPVYKYELEIIKDPIFQRLRRIKQLSFGYYVYHGAEHSRFGHVLGCMHIVEKALRKIQSNGEKYGNSINISDDDVKLARFAALLHDIGHKPFSHALDRLFPEEHEDYSEAFVKYRFNDILKRAGIDDPQQVIDLIKGQPDPEKPFLASLVSGQLDIDKFDYLLRDSHYAGVKYGLFDLDRLLDSLYVKDGGLVVLHGGLYAAEQLIIARYHMFEQVYLHKTKRAFEGMATTIVKHLMSDGKLEYPSTKSLEDSTEMNKFINYDDAWLLDKIRQVTTNPFQHIAEAIRDRSPFKTVIDSEIIRRKMIINREAGQSEGYLNAIEEDIHYNLKTLNIDENEIIFDRVGNLPYKLRPYSNPATGESDESADTVFIYDDETGLKEPIENRSKIVYATAQGYNTRRIFVRRDKHDQLLEYLKGKFSHFR